MKEIKFEIGSSPERTGYQVKFTEPMKFRYGKVNKITTSPILPSIVRATNWALRKIYLDDIMSHPMGGANVNINDMTGEQK